MRSRVRFKLICIQLVRGILLFRHWKASKIQQQTASIISKVELYLARVAHFSCKAVVQRGPGNKMCNKFVKKFSSLSEDERDSN